MAVNIATNKISVDLGVIVTGAIDTVKKTRASEQARKEAEFQRAIADGMSYEEQVSFRETQLKKEKESDFSDVEYIGKLEKSIADSKKLSRFNKYRTKYAQLVSELTTGKINEENYLSTLKGSLDGINDPDLRLEITNDIVEGEKAVKTYRDTILNNQVKKAKYDGTQSALNDAISRVTSARMTASINENDDEVTAYEETLSALRAQLSTVRIQDSMTDFQVRSATRGVNVIEKLNFLNNAIQNADGNTVVKIGDKVYASAQQFWTLERDGFLAGTSQNFGSFFDEFSKSTKDSITASTAKFGYPTQVVLDEVLNSFNDLRSRPEVAPFVAKIDITQASVMSEAVDKLAKVINDIGTNNLTFKEADTQLQNIGKKYGIDVSGYRLQLDEQLRNLARGGVIDESEATALAPDVQVALPKVETPAATPGTTPVTPAPSVVPQTVREVKAGDTLSGIAAETGVSLSQILELNPELKQNPDAIQPGQQVKLPGAAPTPAVTEQPKSTLTTPIPTPTSIPTATTPTPIVPTATPTSAPVSAPTVPVQKPNAYTGSSIVDYLKSVGKDASVDTRAKLALEKGIVKTEQEYLEAARVGKNADLNTRLLAELRKE